MDAEQSTEIESACSWKYDAMYEHWETSCRNLYCFMEGGPEENRMKFCPYCGKRIVRAITGDEEEQLNPQPAPVS